MLDIKSLSASIDGKKILEGFDLKINPGEVHAIILKNLRLTFYLLVL